jgi:predicted lysophospholipase L1 biosynthesis ABC-type transport system permease subunit
MQMIMPPGGATSVPIYGIAEADLPALLDLFGLHLQAGRWPRPRTNEFVISAAIAANRDLHLGDVIGGERDSDDMLVVDDLPVEMVVVGILAPDRPWIGFASYEYLNSHEFTRSRGSRLLIVAYDGQKPVLDAWLTKSLDATQTRIITYATEEREFKEMTESLVLTFAALECMIAAVAAIALGTLNYVFFTQRREEFGVLSAIGHSRRWLTWRTLGETGSVVGMAWAAGAALCGIGLLGVQHLIYGPRGLTIDFFNPAPWLLTLPIPLAVVLASVGTIRWMLSRLDPVAIIEQRQT